MLCRLSVVTLAVAISLNVCRPGDAQTRPIVFPPANPITPAEAAEADSPSADEMSGLKTTVEFEILSGNPAAMLDAHRWTESLQTYGVTVHVRSPKSGDELGVEDKVRGTLRWVIATGELDARGTLKFPDRSFSLRQTSQLKEWIDELKLYGALGAPEGKPLWGLTQTQFATVFESLSRPIANPIRDLSLDEALRQMQLPVELPVTFHSTAKAQLGTLEPIAPVRPAVEGMTSGTALAAVLANYGLGYRPLRTPAGGMELVVEPLANLKQPWPIGWEPEPDVSRGKMAPGLFKMVPVGFDNVPLEDILGAVAEVATIPVIVNYNAAAAKGIDLKKTLVSYPKKRTAYMVVLSSVVRRSRLTHEMRVDEQGAPFIYVTAFVPRTIEDLSPAESD